MTGILWYRQDDGVYVPVTDFGDVTEGDGVPTGNACPPGELYFDRLGVGAAPQASLVRFHRFTEGQRNLASGVEVTLAQFTRQDLDPSAFYKITTFIRAARNAVQISFIWKWPNNATIAGCEWWWSATGGYTSMCTAVYQTGAALNLGAMKLNCTPSAAVELYMDTSSTVAIELVSPSATVPGGN